MNEQSSLNILKDKEFRGSIFVDGQKYLINTLFDSINSILGVVIGLYLANEKSVYIFIMTIISTALALGISSGSSIYEAEIFEQIRKIKEIDKHMIINSEDDSIMVKKAKITGFFVGVINLLTPLLIATIFILLFLICPDLSLAFWSAIVISGVILFVSGVYFGKMNEMYPLKRGLRMLLIGTTTFLVVYIIGIFF